MTIYEQVQETSRFRECESGLHIWPPEAPLSGVSKFGDFIYGIVGSYFSQFTP
jgi:hypothetical protein